MKLLAAALALAGLAGGVAWAGNVDCRLCHSGADPQLQARDFTRYYTDAARHHPRSAAYPPPQDARYFQPGRQDGDIAWFDTDGNSFPDPDEVQLFGAARAVDCASCHREHGEPGQPAIRGSYLRVSVAGALCLVCHRN
ncbi:MAG TPA: hypothetical protein VLC55_06255 [Burkholderiales bacterium]|nr:hypothetical protein [Burkholderiales bacterium]